MNSSSTMATQINHDEINDFAMQIMNEIDISDHDLDPCSYLNGSFEDEEAMDNVDFDLLAMFEDSPAPQKDYQEASAPIVTSSNDAPVVVGGMFGDQEGCNHNVVDEPAFYDTHEYATEEYPDQSISDDMSMTSSSAEQQQIPGGGDDLDQQIQQSMSKLVQSMHRSEMSRNMLGRQQQSMGMFGIGSYLKGYSSLASGLTQSKSQMKNYMSQVGSTSMM